MKKNILILILSVSMIGCAGFSNWWSKVNMEKMELIRVDQKESISQLNLRIDGIYISTFPNRTADFILYNNGLITGSKNNITNNTIEKVIEYCERKTLPNTEITPTGWGVYNVKGNRFTFEQWNGGDNFFVTHFEGMIIDSVTIMVPNYFNNANDIFKFYPLEIKPDSTMKWTEINERKMK